MRAWQGMARSQDFRNKNSPRGDPVYQTKIHHEGQTESPPKGQSDEDNVSRSHPFSGGVLMARAAKGEGTAYKTAEGKWRGYVTVNGKRKYFSAATKTEAARKRRALLHQRDNGHLVAGKVPTVESWINHWMITTRSDRAESTNAGYDYSIAKYIAPAIGSVRLDKLTIEHLEGFYAQMEADGFAGSTRHQCHSIIRVALKHAVWRGHVGRNVAALVKPPKVVASKAESLSEADLAAVYAALDGDRFQARWHLSLDHGLRPGEAIAVEWSHIDFDQKTVSVEQEILHIRGKGATLIKHLKTNSSRRTIALPDYLIDMLKATRQQQYEDMLEKGDTWNQWEPDGKPHAFCFTRADGSVLRPRYDTDLWKSLLSRAGVPHTKRYNSRHTAASMAITDGADIPAVAEMMGHSNPNTTLRVYTHPVEERKRALADRAAMRYLDRVQNKVQPVTHNSE